MAIQTAEKRLSSSPPYPSSLDNEETTVQFDPISTYGAVLRHSCRPEYLAARQVYSQLDIGKDRPRDELLDSCRSNAWFTRHCETGEIRVAANACHLRWCPICATARRNYIGGEVDQWLRESDHPKFVTLTLKHTEAPLGHQVKHLYRCFRELRRRKDFIELVHGGVWFFQIKKSKTDRLWHPHIHCLVTGKYLPHSLLKHLWLSITYSSTVVDIRPVRDPEHAAREAARYAASPGTLHNLNLDSAMELVLAMHGRRICGTWGDAKCVHLRPPKMEDKDKWISLGGWQTVMGKRETDHNARAIIFAWQDKHPLPAGIDCLPAYSIQDLSNKYDWAGYDFDAIYNSERSPPCYTVR